MINGIEKSADIRIANPIYLSPCDSHPQSIQCIVWATPRSESVAETKKVLLVNLIKYPNHRLLDYLVLQRSYADWTSPPVGFGYPDSLRGLGSISATLHALVEVRQSLLHSLTIFMPGHLIYAGCGITL